MSGSGNQSTFVYSNSSKLPSQQEKQNPVVGNGMYQSNDQVDRTPFDGYSSATAYNEYRRGGTYMDSVKDSYKRAGRNYSQTRASVRRSVKDMIKDTVSDVKYQCDQAFQVRQKM